MNHESLVARATMRDGCKGLLHALQLVNTTKTLRDNPAVLVSIRCIAKA